MEKEATAAPAQIRLQHDGIHADSLFLHMLLLKAMCICKSHAFLVDISDMSAEDREKRHGRIFRNAWLDFDLPSATLGENLHACIRLRLPTMSSGLNNRVLANARRLI